VHFELAPVYEKIGVSYVDGRATTIKPDDREVTVQTASGEERMIAYDFLLNATGPYLNFEATPGLGPSTGNTTSVCSVEHAVEARDRYLDVVRELKPASAGASSWASATPARPAREPLSST